MPWMRLKDRHSSEPSDSESIFKGLIAFVQRPQAIACGRFFVPSLIERRMWKSKIKTCSRVRLPVHENSVMNEPHLFGLP
ncbi:MAG TPA: hypothetical protein DEP78_00790, partial [Verrucomicrobiales bacterium]|nr:hypothetical protein [Verrucomicrobiales bacterium]